MSLVNVLKAFFGGGNDAAAERKMAEETARAVASIDLQAAIAAHENWKYRLQVFLEGRSTEKFVAEAICFDDRCDLGKWIHGAGCARLGTYPGFTALRGHHKMFHYSASNVVSLSQAGKADEAQRILNTQFAQQSAEVVKCLEALMAVVRKSV